MRADSSNSTVLDSRTLWADGDSTYSADVLMQQIQLGTSVEGMFVDAVTEDIVAYNKLVPTSQQLTIKQDVRDPDFAWNIPNEYSKLDVRQYLVDRLSDQADMNDWSDSELKRRIIRVGSELKLYEQMNLVDILRVIIYIINTLQSNNITWGVGRGSSVSSYVLYLIGVHDVDSVFYELDIEDFLRTTE